VDIRWRCRPSGGFLVRERAFSTGVKPVRLHAGGRATDEDVRTRRPVGAANRKKVEDAASHQGDADHRSE
jgi:hypothetical protein